MRLLEYVTIILFGLIDSSFVMCNEKESCVNCGAVLYKQRIRDRQTNEIVLMRYSKDRKLWFYDSLVIAEGIRIDIDKDIYGKEVWKGTVHKYTFINLRTKSFYEYASFSDTAQIIDKYLQPDSGRVEGGWNFFDKDEILNRKTLIDIPDTIINGITYKRMKSTRDTRTDMEGEVNLTTIGYFRCDKKNSLFTIDRPLIKQVGCPLVKIENEGKGTIPWNSFEIEFLEEKLTPAEIKVFKAWQKNAIKNPAVVKKSNRK